MPRIKTLLISLGTFAVGEILLAVAGYVTLADQVAEPLPEEQTPPREVSQVQPLALKEWYNRIETWRRAREQGELDRVISFYADSFHSTDGQGLAALQTESEKHIKRYDWRSITIDSVEIAAVNSQRIVTFLEQYHCPGFFRAQRRTLWFAQTDSAWKIVTASDSSVFPVCYPDQFILAFIFTWRDVWDSGQLDAYINKYDSTFRTGSHTFASWKKYKKAPFQRAEQTRVDVSDFEFTSIAPEVWKVAFVQRSISPSHEGWGRKVLKIHGEPGNFKINHETWIPLESYVQ